jgi:hypothetical protein
MAVQELLKAKPLLPYLVCNKMMMTMIPEMKISMMAMSVVVSAPFC